MYDIVTIGTASRDVFLRSKLFRIIRDPEHLKRLGFVTGEAECFALGGKIEVDDLVMSIGGGAANAAVTFARQGLKTGAILQLGSDAAARDIREHLRREKIVLDALHPRGKTAYSVILLSPDGERTILVFRGNSENLSSQDVAKKMEARWAYIVPGTIPLAELAKITAVLKRKKTKIAFAPSRHVLEAGLKRAEALFNQSDVVLLNREEAALLSGVDFKKAKKIFKRLDAVVKGIVVVTDGPRGVLVSDGKTIYAAGIFKGKIVDRTGAGDAFGSGFVAGLIRKNSKFEMRNPKFSEDVCYAIRLGSANATSVVEHVGAEEGILTRQRFEKETRWKKFSITEHRL